MHPYLPIIRIILFVLFVGCYITSFLCIFEISPIEHNYHFYLFAGSAFLLMFNLSFFMEVSRNFQSGINKKKGDIQKF